MKNNVFFYEIQILHFQYTKIGKKLNHPKNTSLVNIRVSNNLYVTMLKYLRENPL